MELMRELRGKSGDVYRKGRSCQSQPAAGGVSGNAGPDTYYAILNILIEVRLHLLTKVKCCPLHFPKRRPGPEDTAGMFRVLLPQT